jgi:dienelactone hydrolase
MLIAFFGTDMAIFPNRLILCLSFIAICPATFAQQWNISPPNPVLYGTPLSIKLTGLQPNQEVNFTAERIFATDTKDVRVIHRSSASFIADPEGIVDLNKQASKEGSYTGIDPAGLFWSLLPTKEVVANDRPSLEVRITAFNNERQSLASTAVSFINALPDVKIEPVPSFPGAVFATRGGPVKRGALIVLGGSEGGASITKSAAPLASQGFAVLALPYHSPNFGPNGQEVPGLPSAFADIPVERLNEARRWLNARADIDGTRIGVMGTSKGAEFALLAGVHLGWPKVVVAIVPTDVVWEGFGANFPEGTRSSFALNKRPLPFVPYKGAEQEFKGLERNEPVYFRRPSDNGRAANPAKAVAARIQVEKIKAPLLVIGGHDDQTWASGMMAQNIAEARVASKFETLALIYPKAGHYLGGNGYGPTIGHNEGLWKVGGTPEDDARAQADAWPKTMAFLRKYLAGK